MFQLVGWRPGANEKWNLINIDVAFFVHCIELDFVDELDGRRLFGIIWPTVNLDTVNPVLETTL